MVEPEQQSLQELEASEAGRERFDRFMTVVLLMMLLPLMNDIVSGFWIAASSTGAMMGAFALLWVVGRGGAPRRRAWAVHGMLGVGAVGLFHLARVAAMERGMVRDAFHFLVILPIVAGYLLSAGAAVLWAVVCSVGIAAFYFLYRPYFTYAVEGNLRVHEMVILLAIAIFSYANRKSVTRYVATIQRQNDALPALNQTLEQKGAERTAHLERALEEAQAAVRVRSAFLAQMSHELRTPLHGVLNSVEELRHTPLRDEQQQLLSAASEATAHLHHTLASILDATEVERGDVSIQEVAFDPAGVLSRVLLPHEAAARQRGLAWVVEGGEALPKTLLGDGRRWQAILDRVVANAVKFTLQGQITLRVRPRMLEGNCWVKVEVEDTGIGMESPERVLTAAQHLADASTTRRFGGTGFNLRSAARLASLMGGALQLTSKVGAGTRAVIDLPFQPVSFVQVEEAARVALQALPGTGRAILIAEDNGVNRKVLQVMLTRLGVREIVAVEDGQQAVARVLAEPGRWAGVLMDCQMPVMDGYTATRALREVGATLPIVAVTANALERDREAALAAGMDGWLPKPVQAPALEGILAAWGVIEGRSAPASAPPATPPQGSGGPGGPG